MTTQSTAFANHAKVAARHKLKTYSGQANSIFGEIFGFEEHEAGKLGRRALPLLIRFKGFAEAGSAMGILNLYYGFINSIFMANKQMHMYCKMWGFLWGVHLSYIQTSKEVQVDRMRACPGKAWLAVYNSPRMNNLRRGAIEVSRANMERDVIAGLKDAADVFNGLMAQVEKITATKLMHLLDDDVAERKRQYHENATKIRQIAALAVYDDIRSRLPRGKARGMAEF